MVYLQNSGSISLQYRGRIHRAKFTSRSIRYVLSDLMARNFPALQRYWLFPIDSQPIEDAARETFLLPSRVADVPAPESLFKLGISPACPTQQAHRVFSVDDVTVTGWAGAMAKNGLLLTLRANHNWVSSLRARHYRTRTLSATRPYFNLMAPVPARGHMFHWLFDSVLPLVSFLESGRAGKDLGLIVNAAQSELQRNTIDFVRSRYDIRAIEPVADGEALFVPHSQIAVADFGAPRGLQSPLGLARAEDLGRFIAGNAAWEAAPKRIYVSRNDARLRRVLNEDALLPELEARGFQRVTLAGMPLARQVALFLNAEAVAGQHGAGLTHIAWCKPGTKVAEIFPSLAGRRKVKNATAEYWLISWQRELSYSGHAGGPVETRLDGFNIPRETLIQAIES